MRSTLVGALALVLVLCGVPATASPVAADVVSSDGAVHKVPTLASSAPRITGKARVGKKLKAKPGNWQRGAKLSFRWLAGGKRVGSGRTLKVGQALLGKKVVVQVRGTARGFRPATRSSRPVTVRRGTMKLGWAAFMSTPWVEGVQKIGVSGWPAGATLTYAWFADGVPISGATTNTWTLRPAEFDKIISVAVTGHRAGYRPATRRIAHQQPVQAGRLRRIRDGGWRGKALVGCSMRAWPYEHHIATADTWQWTVGGVVVGTSDRYTFSSSQYGQWWKVEMTSRAHGYQDDVTFVSGQVGRLYSGEECSPIG